MSIKLLALDLDGTLLNSRGEISARNLEAISAARGRGVRVALVTGRRFRDARPLALELGLDAPVVSHNGALTKHARTLETIAVKLLPPNVARQVVSIGRALNADAMVSDDPQGFGVLLYDHISPHNHALAKYIEWSRRVVGDDNEIERVVRRVPSLEDYLDHAPIHIGFSGTCAAIKHLGACLKREFGDQIQALSTLYMQQDFALLDVLHPEASKGAGLAAVAAECGLQSAEVMAVGDNYNDLEMLRYAGTGVLMGNADVALRHDAPFHTTASNDADGVALAIEKFILHDEYNAQTRA